MEFHGGISHGNVRFEKRTKTTYSSIKFQNSLSSINGFVKWSFCVK